VRWQELNEVLSEVWSPNGGVGKRRAQIVAKLLSPECSQEEATRLRGEHAAYDHVIHLVSAHAQKERDEREAATAAADAERERQHLRSHGLPTH
jgi:IS5 family transposase